MRKSSATRSAVLLLWCAAMWVTYFAGWGQALWPQQGARVLQWMQHLRSGGAP